jgi:hypothetical protein
MLLIWHRRQETFAEVLFVAYLKGNITSLAVGDLILPEDASFEPFDVSWLLVSLSRPWFTWVPARSTGEPSQPRRSVFGGRDCLLS